MPSECIDACCTKRACFGVEGTKTADFFPDHKKEGMMDVVRKRCGHPGCDKLPTFGVEGSKAVEFALDIRRRAW